MWAYVHVGEGHVKVMDSGYNHYIDTCGLVGPKVFIS